MTQENQDTRREEEAYLQSTLLLIQRKLKEEGEKIGMSRQDMIRSRREQWENTSHTWSDWGKLVDFNATLDEDRQNARNMCLQHGKPSNISGCWIHHILPVLI